MRFLVLLLALLITGLTNAQVPSINKFFVPDSLSETTHIRLPRLQGFGKYHWENDWYVGNIYLKNSEKLKGYYLRYDILRNQIEIIVDDQYNYITHHQIDSLEWYNVKKLKQSRLINCANYEIKEADFNGFMEVLVDGEVMLLKRKFVYSLRESTSPTLVNDTDNETRVFETYYIMQNDTMEELAGGRRKNIKVLDQYKKQIEKFIKDNSLGFNAENDLINIVNYYNYLLKNPTEANRQ